MARWIQKYEVPLRIRLHVATRRSKVEHFAFARSEVLHREIEVDLLWCLAARPRRWLVALHRDRGQPQGTEIDGNERVASVRDLPTERGRPEIGENVRVGAVKRHGTKSDGGSHGLEQ